MIAAVITVVSSVAIHYQPGLATCHKVMTVKTPDTCLATKQITSERTGRPRPITLWALEHRRLFTRYIQGVIDQSELVDNGLFLHMCTGSLTAGL